MRPFKFDYSMPVNEEQARHVILKNASVNEIRFFKDNPDMLKKHVDAILGNIDEDDIGVRWVLCEKHGMTCAAMKFGMDDRCSKCVIELLARHSKIIPCPMKSPVGGIFFWDYKYGEDKSK